MAKPHTEERHKVLEGKAAELGTEIYGEECKDRPKIKPGGQAAALAEAPLARWRSHRNAL